jgi:acetylglutamate kinase
MDEKNLELLYRSFDSELNQSEQKKLDKALENSKELKSHKEEMLKMRNSLKSENPQNFGYMFADKVMGKINKLDEKSIDEQYFDSIISIFRPIAIAATFLLVFLVSYNVISENGNIFNGSQQSQDITLAEAFDPFNELIME